ncbi:hypothetical protein AB0J28_47705, partial [Streptosporangium canum]
MATPRTPPVLSENRTAVPGLDPAPGGVPGEGDLMDVLRNVIAGESRDPASGEWMDLVDPATGKVYGRAPRSGTGDVEAAVAAAVADLG